MTWVSGEFRKNTIFFSVSSFHILWQNSSSHITSTSTYNYSFNLLAIIKKTAEEMLNDSFALMQMIDDDSLQSLMTYDITKRNKLLVVVCVESAKLLVIFLCVLRIIKIIIYSCIRQSINFYFLLITSHIKCFILGIGIKLILESVCGCTCVTVKLRNQKFTSKISNFMDDGESLLNCYWKKIGNKEITKTLDTHRQWREMKKSLNFWFRIQRTFFAHNNMKTSKMSLLKWRKK